MFARFVRSLIALAAVVVCYQAYCLLAVPVLEPSIARANSREVTEEEYGSATNAVERYQKLLANYFPRGHWSLSGPVKVIESGPVLLVLDDYRRDDRGRVDLTKCAVVMFPTPRGKGNGPVPRDVVILEAPGGARLQFDETFNPGRGRIGKITSGEFPGIITIRSEGRERGTQDDLWIETRDLRINESLVFTPAAVNLRYGNSRGSGKRLEIKLLQEEGGGSGLKIAGIESIELFEEVQLDLKVEKLNPFDKSSTDKVAASYLPNHINSRTLLGSGGVTKNVALTAYTLLAQNTNDRLAKEAAAWQDGPTLAPTRAPQPQLGPALGSADRPARERPPAQPNPPPTRQLVTVGTTPVEVTCQGSFRMDLVTMIASFRDQVIARQLNLNGPSDQLTCNQLDIHFADDDFTRVAPADDPDYARRQRGALSNLRPRRIEAIGDPVKVDSPARGAMIRGQVLRIDVEERQLTLDGGRAVIVHTAGEIHAPLIRYRHPAENSPDAIGNLWVGGPGWLRARQKSNDPSRVIESHWRTAPGVEFPVRLVTNNGQPTLIVQGGPVVSAPGVGKLTAGQMRIAFREVAPDGKNGPAIELGQAKENQPQRAILPERIDAIGTVEINSAELAGRTERLTAYLRPGQLNTATNNSGGDQSIVSRNRNNSMADAEKSAGEARYLLSAKQMELDVVMSGKRSEPTTLVCTGNAQFSENKPPTPGEEPLVVRGESIRVDQIHTRQVRVDVTGGPAAADSKGPVSTITARGMTVRAADVHLDQAHNRLWSDGPGDARVKTTRDLMGQATGAATELFLSWKGGLDFDGRKITVSERVRGDSAHDWLRCNKLIATLSQPVDFNAGTGRLGKDKIEIAQVDCTGQVSLDHRGVDAQGQKSHERAQLATLRINQLTGEMSGLGPGWVRSVHLSKSGGLNLNGERPAPSLQNSNGQAAGTKLGFLRVEFQQSVTGNMNNRVMAFHGNVRSVYGPVAAWEQELPLVNVGGLPPDTATLSADHLQVNEDPLARLTGSGQANDKKIGPLELKASGNVDLEGSAKDGSQFTAQAGGASYNQTKELFLLEGTNQANAKIWIKRPTDQRPSPLSARKISYWRTTGRVKVEDFGSATYGVGAKPRQGSQR